MSYEVPQHESTPHPTIYEVPDQDQDYAQATTDNTMPVHDLDNPLCKETCTCINNLSECGSGALISQMYN